VKTQIVDLKKGKTVVCDLFGDGPITFNHRVIPHPAKEPVTNSRRSPAPGSDYGRTLRGDGDPEDRCTSFNDFNKILRGIQIQAHDDPKPVPERRTQKTLPGCCAYQGEVFERQFYRSGTWAFANHYINKKILHCRVEDLFNHRVHAVYLIYEKNIASLECGNKGCNIPGFFQYRNGCCSYCR